MFKKSLVKNSALIPIGEILFLPAGPTNFNEADGRSLYVHDFLLIAPEKVASDPDGVVATLQNAINTHGGSRSLSAPTSSSSGFFDIEEETNALYLQANFEHDFLEVTSECVFR